VTINLDNYSFDEWVDFVFNHSVAEEGEKAWYWQDEWNFEVDANRTLENAIRLFNRPATLVAKYTSEQIDQGFWFLLHGRHALNQCIWDDDVNVELRIKCVLAMPNVFRAVFAKQAIQDACYMWWDLLITFTENLNAQIANAMLHALSEILTLDSPECQRAALHGLGHLAHPEKSPVIDKYLETHPHLDADLRKYALAAIVGEVQ